MFLPSLCAYKASHFYPPQSSGQQADHYQSVMAWASISQVSASMKTSTPSSGFGLQVSHKSRSVTFRLLTIACIQVWIYYVALWFAKMAILLQYLRIFPHRSFRRINIGVMVFVTIYGIWSVCSAIWACTPISYFWRQGIVQGAEGKCLNRLAVWYEAHFKRLARN